MHDHYQTQWLLTTFLANGPLYFIQFYLLGLLHNASDQNQFLNFIRDKYCKITFAVVFAKQIGFDCCIDDYWLFQRANPHLKLPLKVKRPKILKKFFNAHHRFLGVKYLSKGAD